MTFLHLITSNRYVNSLKLFNLQTRSFDWLMDCVQSDSMLGLTHISMQCKINSDCIQTGIHYWRFTTGPLLLVVPELSSPTFCRPCIVYTPSQRSAVSSSIYQTRQQMETIYTIKSISTNYCVGSEHDMILSALL